MSNRSRVKLLAEMRVPPPPDNVVEVVREVMKTAATFAKALWIRRAGQLNIRRSGEYIRGIEDAVVEIENEQATTNGIQVSLTITNKAPHAGLVENGHGAFHLPSHINWSGPNVKHGKNGPYLHIPFRFAAYQNAEERAAKGTTYATIKQMMPEEIYAKAKRLVFTNVGVRSNAPSSRQRVSDYQSGFINHAADAGMGLVLHRRTTARSVGFDANGKELINPAWGSSRFHGLMKTGRKGHAQYMTIRTITPQSQGWNIPAQAGHGVARQVARAISGGAGSERFRQLLADSALRALRLQ